VISKKDADKFLAVLPTPRSPSRRTLNRRHRQYIEMLHRATVRGGQVLRDLTRLKTDKDLSSASMPARQARSLLVTELALARKIKKTHRGGIQWILTGA